MKEIYKTKIEGSIKNLICSDESISFEVNSIKHEIGTDHDQDCCEHVFGDFSNFKYHKDEIEKNYYKSLTVFAVPNMGVVIAFDDYAPAKVLVPCYNNQNGFYSDNLQLYINIDNTKTKIDITECKVDSDY